jgi:hypothetical protein
MPEPRGGSVLGYHAIGDYFSFTVLSGPRYLGDREDERFDTPLAFAGLVTAAHEHYHLLQDLTQGFFWWRQISRDLLTEFMADAVRQASVAGRVRFPFCEKVREVPTSYDTRSAGVAAPAQALSIELAVIEKYLNSPALTEQLLRDEMRVSAALKDLVSDDLLQLTTIDLVECHAAILTELYVTKMMAEQPSRFNPGVARDLAELYRVDRMLPAYLRPLRAVVHIFERFGIKLESTSPTTHPLYSEIRHGMLYVLLAVLLDYSLHLPPAPLKILNEARDVSAQQDIYPPFRFINLAVLWALELRTNRGGLRETLRREADYYSRGVPALARLVNKMHDRITLGRIIGKRRKPTFFSIQEGTEKWSTYLHGNPMEKRFALPYHVLNNALAFRSRRPDFWLALAPFDDDVEIGNPKITLTAEGLSFVPYFSDRTAEFTGNPESLKAFLQSAAMTHVESVVSETADVEKMRAFSPTLVPKQFMDASMTREMSFRASTLLLHGGELRCPLTESIGRYMPCASRTRSCENIPHPDELPRQQCQLRDTVRDLFPVKAFEAAR